MEDITAQTEAFTELYREREAELPNTMVKVTFSNVKTFNDSKPSVEEITMAVRSLNPGKQQDLQV